MRCQWTGRMAIRAYTHSKRSPPSLISGSVGIVVYDVYRALYWYTIHILYTYTMCYNPYMHREYYVDVVYRSVYKV